MIPVNGVQLLYHKTYEPGWDVSRFGHRPNAGFLNRKGKLPIIACNAIIIPQNLRTRAGCFPVWPWLNSGRKAAAQNSWQPCAAWLPGLPITAHPRSYFTVWKNGIRYGGDTFPRREGCRRGNFHDWGRRGKTAFPGKAHGAAPGRRLF